MNICTPFRQRLLVLIIVCTAQVVQGSPDATKFAERTGAEATDKVEELISNEGPQTPTNSDFALYRVMFGGGSRVRYVIYTGTINDSIEYAFSSTEEALEFFSVRFQGIGNDLVHEKLRPDAVPSELNNIYAESGFASLGFSYLRYGKAMERALSRLRTKRDSEGNSKGTGNLLQGGQVKNRPARQQ